MSGTDHSGIVVKPLLQAFYVSPMHPQDSSGSGDSGASAAEASTSVERSGIERSEIQRSEIQRSEIQRSEIQRDQGDGSGRDAMSPGARLGRYVVLEEIGQGGMGLVFSAYDPELNRKVALKLLRPRHRERKRRRSRLLQEAQALAKLAHPNVITVYDVGTLDDGRVFVAMELVEGDTLKGWLKETKRRWDEVLSVFLPAGRGLAAAHAANLVHRDFKPENVLIGRDGRVRVMDFGLARPMETMTGTSDGGLEPDLDEDDDDALPEELEAPAGLADPNAPQLTQTGSLMGTPAFMAPEQHLGKATDLRSDQFSFCCALYQGLYGEYPFEGSDAGELAKQKLAGAVKDPPAGSGVPGWIRRILLRGLAPEPNDRFSSMDQLLDELAKDPRIKRRKIIATAGMVSVVGGAVFGIHYLRTRQPDTCNDAPDRFAAVWNEERSAAARQGLQAVQKEHDLAHVPQTWDFVKSTIDAYGESWIAMHTEACEATHIRGEQSTRLLELRNNCLQERLDEVDALVGLLAQADRGAAGRAARASTNISPIAACADSEALAAAVDPPGETRSADRPGEDVKAVPMSDAEKAAKKKAVAEIRRKLARIKMMGMLGQLDEALELAQATYEEAGTLDYPPVVAEARYRLGQIQGWRGDGELANENLSEAAWQGSSVKHDSIAAAASSELVRVVGLTMDRHDEALSWARHAEAAIKRIGLTGRREADLRLDIGVIQDRAGHPSEARAALQQALELYQVAPAATLALADTHIALADASLHRDRGPTGAPPDAQSIDEARKLVDDAVKSVERTLSKSHPELAAPLRGRARVLDAEQRHDEAIEQYEAALAVATEALGSDDLELVPILSELAQSHAGHESYEQAVRHRMRIHDLLEQRLGEHPRVASALYEIGTTLERAGKHDDARSYHERALSLWEKTRGKDHADVAFALTRLGLLDVHAGEPKRAVDRLERALKLRGGRGLDPQLLAETQFALAQALHATGGDHPRARELATKARDTFAKGKSPNPSRAQQIDAWLDAVLRNDGDDRRR